MTYSVLERAYSLRNQWRQPGAPSMGMRKAFDLATKNSCVVVYSYSGRIFGSAACTRDDSIVVEESHESDIGLRDVQEAVVRFSRSQAEVYHADPDCGGGQEFRPVVARIGTARRSSAVKRRHRVTDPVGYWLAGYREDGGYIVLDRTLYAGECDAAPEDAAYAAHDLARTAAEREAEYENGWSRGAQAREELGAAHDALGDALDYVSDLRRAEYHLAQSRRTLRTAGADDEYCASNIALVQRVIRDKRARAIQDARAAWQSACATWSDAAPGRRDAAQYAAGWRDGARISGDDSWIVVRREAPRT
jgi:hypothetical protein